MVTLRTVVRTPDLGLRVVAGERGLDVELTGAHASEQKDPTPWLAGGELLMIDGLSLGRGRAAQHDYVTRLRRRGVAALALGIGGSLPFADVPAGLVAAANNVGLPLVAVPVTTPFIAITQVVYARMADERLAISERTLAGQRQLTAAAATLDPPAAICATLARLIAGWAETLDPHGRPLGLTRPEAARPPGEPGGARPTTELVRAHLPDLTRGGLHTSVTVADAAGGHVIAPLGVNRVRGLLAYGRGHPGPADRLTTDLAGFAASLLSIELERRHTVRMLERQPGADVVDRLLAGVPAARAAQLVASVGLRAERVRVLLVAGGDDQPEEFADTLVDAVPEALVRVSAGGLRVVVPADVPGLLDRLTDAVGPLPAGLGGPVRPQHCPASFRQAEQALVAARQRDGGLVDAMRLGSLAVLLQFATADGLAAFADAVLGPVEERDPVRRLTRSLRAFLAANGNHDQAAAQARVHRHTLRRHLARVEELTGRRLDNARDRIEFWLAYEARDAVTTL